MEVVIASAWRADWLNAWLAAVGVTVLCEEVKLAWTDDPAPVSKFMIPDGFDLFGELARRLPNPDFIGESALRFVVGQNSTEEQYAIGATTARTNGDWLWSAFFTDLGPADRKPKGREGAFDKSIFYPGMPGTAPIAKRIADIAKNSWGDPSAIRASTEGSLLRVQGNGLGFDSQRLLGTADPNGGVFVDPVVECLAFFGLMLLPVRGDTKRVNTRGQIMGAFSWFTWDTPLNFPGIDAVFTGPEAIARSRFELVRFRKKSSSEATAGYFSKKIS